MEEEKKNRENETLKEGGSESSGGLKGGEKQWEGATKVEQVLFRSVAKCLNRKTALQTILLYERNVMDKWIFLEEEGVQQLQMNLDKQC